MTCHRLSSLIRVFVLIGVGLLGQGCASIISGTTQDVTLDTNPHGAACEFKREGATIATIAKTPQKIEIDKTKHDIHVTCHKEGYEEATAVLESGVESATLGNIILGGGIGWAIDSAAGADNKYPEYLTLPLVPKASSDNQSRRLLEPERPSVSLRAPPAPPDWRVEDRREDS